MSVARPCTCDRFLPGRLFDAGRDCPKCWLFAHRPAVRQAWGGDPADCAALVLARRDMPATDLADLLAGPPPLMPDDWRSWPVTREAHLLLAERLLAAVPPYPAGSYHGRGVVIAGGGRYFPGVYVTVRALRHLGCRLPIQVWYLGRNEEMPAARQALLAPFAVECVDAEAVRRRHPARILNGWELKVFATLHCPFEEVLFLDADCYPCRNPEFLFEREDYQLSGAVFWPDLMAADGRLDWPAFGVADPGRGGSVESGQYLLHKRLSWRALNLAWFYNDHSDYYYRHCYGDKHTFEVAWTRCGQPWLMWQPLARWQDVAYVHLGPDQLPLFVHRCADKFRFEPESFPTAQRYPGPAYNPNLPLEAECWGWLGELLQALRPRNGRSAGVPVPEKVIRVGLPGHFNCSLAEHRGRLLLASRHGWLGARLYLSELTPDYQPHWTRPLCPAHPQAESGLEDPRLFLFRGQLHCAFTGLEGEERPGLIHQLVCRLDEQYGVEEVWLPAYEGRAIREKNWGFFEHDGELYSVYSVHPHRILRHRGRQAKVVAQTATRLPWSDYHLRGGAPPLRVGREFYHFFHAMRQSNGQKDYAVGIYTFAARPPFEVCRVASTPVLLPDEHDRPAGLGASVVFPCGALWREGRWVISYGYHDRECRIAVLAADEVERLLRPA
jgi:predicted GH43/DUF377 family glycosyl hydrolase